MNNLMSISSARAILPELVDKVNDTMGRVTITVSGQPKAVLLSAEELESLEETAEVLSIPGAKDSILKGLIQAKNKQGISMAELK